jgi:hypothetical protein
MRVRQRAGRIRDARRMFGREDSPATRLKIGPEPSNCLHHLIYPLGIDRRSGAPEIAQEEKSCFVPGVVEHAAEEPLPCVPIRAVSDDRHQVLLLVDDVVQGHWNRIVT